MKPIRRASMLVLSLALAACSKDAPKPASSEAPPQKPMTPPALTGPVPVPYEEPMVGGAVMAVGQDLMSNISKSRDHTTLVKALDAAGLAEALRGPGPYTLFAPTNAAFDQLPAGTLETLMQPANREELLRILSYHLVAAKLDAEALQSLVIAGNGSAVLKTVEGTSLKATVANGKAMLVDAKGGLAAFTTPNVVQSNGVMHVVDKVLMPGS